MFKYLTRNLKLGLTTLAILTACGGGGTVTISAADAAKLEAELQGAKTAQSQAETSLNVALSVQAETETAMDEAKAGQAEAERLRGFAETAMNSAVSAQLNVNKEIERLKNELAKAIKERDSARGDKKAADLRITELEGDLLTAIDERDTARGRITELEGQLLKATNDKNAADAKVLRLTGELSDANADVERLTGELGDANAEVNHLTGNLKTANTEITRLDQLIRPTYANWKFSVNLEAVPNTATPQNQFLQADEDSISTEGTTAGPSDVQTLNLLTATFDGLPLDGEAADGVAFFQGQINSTNYNYAGIFSGTDLGAPITDRAGTVAIWYGSFDHTLNPSKDFALTVTFNKIGGTLDAFISAGIANNSFIFDDVRFDARGLITGEVLYTTFAHNDPTATPITQTATLRGLIGEAGAVGVFVGEVGSNIAGGFVATPTATLDSDKLNFADWGGVDGDPKKTVINADNTDTEPLLYGVASVVDSGPLKNFIHGLATFNGFGFNLVGTPFASARQVGSVLLLGADSPSGVVFSQVSGTGVTGNKYYAGLLPTTALGAPITAPITAKDLSAIWTAKAAFTFDNIPHWNDSFKMQVIFNGTEGTIKSGTYSSQVFTPGRFLFLAQKGAKTLNIQGRFGSDGVLYGTISYDSDIANGTLTGLIGVNGAVGAFVGGIGVNIVGGFVAHPIARVDFADWGGAAGNRRTGVMNSDGVATFPLLNGVASVGNENQPTNFIQGLPTVAGQGFDFTGTAFADADVTGDVLLLGEDSPSGVAFSRVSGTGVTGDQSYTGVLPTTTLGAPITDINTDVIWNAKLKVVLGDVGSDINIKEYLNPSFKMRVRFDGNGGTINSGTVLDGVFTKGSVVVPYTNLTSLGANGSDYFNIQGKFGDDGLLYGTVGLGSKTDDTLTGLIGVDGAVGAFVGGGDFHMVGGFVAHPTANVNFADWGGTFGDPKAIITAGNAGTAPLLNGAASVRNSGPRVNFIQGLATSTLADKGFDFAGTPFANASVHGNVLLLAEGSPSGIAFSHVSGTGVTDRRYYAGLLPGTNLGVPITDPNTSAIWGAKLKGIYGLGSSTPSQVYSNLNFKMQVTFDGNDGTISSGTDSGSSFTPGQISTDGFGNFNIQGKFNDDGLLYGTVGLGSGTEGTLTGLIGVDGAVGVFAFAGEVTSYAGGFVAAPPSE